jgi:SMODS-associating 2TM, beta-strand rich effector domain
MHEYSIDVERNKIIFGLAAISIIFSGLISSFINAIIVTIPLIEFTVSIAAMGVFGFLYTIFDKYIWKWKFLKTIGVVQTPNLNGTWKGEFKSSYHEFKKSCPAVLIVEQSWSKICIRGKFNYSKSSSYTASLKINDGGGTRLIYSYYNDKQPEHYEEGMSNHRGYGSIEVIDNSMSGHYFNDPTNNKNHGTLTLSR